MELHYFTIKRQTEYLNQILIGGIIESCFTQRKNELIITIQPKQGKVQEILLSCHPRYPFINFREVGKRAKNSTDVLGTLIGLQISTIQIMENDRVIRMEFSNREVIFILQFFRQNSNFFLIDQEGVIVASFKKQKKLEGNRYEIKPPQAANPLSMNESDFLATIQKHPDSALSTILKKDLLFLTKIVINELEFRCQFPLGNPVGDYDEVRLSYLHQEMIGLLTAMQKDQPRIYSLNDRPRIFSLTELKSCQEYQFKLYPDINEAWAAFIFGRLKYDRFDQKQQKIEHTIRDRLDYLDTLISQLKQMPDESEERARYQKMGELLLAQMYSLPEYVDSVEITDLYDPQQPKITVKLDPKLNLQENAREYFEKAKSVAEKRREVKKRLIDLEKEREELEQLAKNIDQDISLTDLNRMERKLAERHVIQTDVDTLEEIHLPYKRYYFEGWEIRVGKNARSNDELTFRNSHKEDFWLHAQGSGGSHVVICNPQRKESIPGKVLTYAGTLAARNSKAKHSSIVPVIYTRVKYVRKIKGAPPGTVNAERIKTIFVELKK